jgi:capsular polysaccharide biosynthesis protein
MAGTEQFTSQGDAREAVQEVLRAIKRNKIRVVFTTIVVVLLGVALSLLWPDKYEASTQFVLRDWKVVMDAVLLDQLQDLPVTKKTKTLENELRSRKRVEAVMNELQWTEWLETASKETERRKVLDKLAENLQVAVDASLTGDYSVTITFRWTTALKARDFVNRTRDLWVQSTIETYKKTIEEQKDRMEGVLQDREADYNAALGAVKQYQEEHDVPGLMSPEVNNDLKSKFEAELVTSKAEMDKVAGDLQRLTEEEQTLTKTVPGAIAPATAEQAEILVKLATAEAKLKSASDPVTGYTPVHPARKQAQAEYDQLIAQLEKTGYDTKGGTVVDQTNPAWVAKEQERQAALTRQRELSALVAQYQKEMDAASDRNDKLPVANAELQRLNADVIAKAQLVSDAKLAVAPLKEKVAQLRQQNFGGDNVTFSAEQSGPFEILEVGVEPDAPVLPITAIILAVSLVVGVFLGAMGPVISEMTRSSFGTVREVGRTLGVPVLGAVDLILTARDLRARRLQQGLTYATMALVVLSLATAIYIYQVHPDVLPQALWRALRQVKMALT